MPDLERLAGEFEYQAVQCAAGGSPFYEGLSRAIAGALRIGSFPLTPFGEDELHGRWPMVALRFLAGMHYLALSGEAAELRAFYPSCGGEADVEAAFECFPRIADAHAARLAKFIARAPQTNEVGRSTLIMASMCLIAQATALPLRLRETGASAGLNLRWDRYSYACGDWRCGDSAARVAIETASFRGIPPSTERFPEIIDRRGCDLNPLDATLPQSEPLLVAYVWTDVRERVERVRAAARYANTFPVTIDREDALEWLGAHAAVAPGAVTVVFHSSFLGYLSQDQSDQFYATIAHLARSATRAAPFALVGIEGSAHGHKTRVRLWPHRIDKVIASSDGHARHIEWLAESVAR